MRDYKINQEVIREIVRVIKSDMDSKIREYAKVRKGLNKFKNCLSLKIGN